MVTSNLKLLEILAQTKILFFENYHFCGFCEFLLPGADASF